MMVPVNAQVRERTCLGFALDTIRIPIPFLRPIAVQRPSDVTFQMPATQVATGGGFVAPAAGMAMPVAFAPGMVAPAMGGGFVAPQGGMMMVPQQTVGYGQVTVQGQMPVQQAALLQQTGQGAFTVQQLAQIQAALAAPQPPAAGFSPGGETAQERLKAAEQQLKELQQLCEKLNAAKQKPDPKAP
jgi:hypothetical protein